MARRMLPPLNAVRAFEAAARNLSFSEAAGELNVTPAAVSQQVKLLEEHLGAKLFRRLNREVELTEAGRCLLPGVGDGLDQIAKAWARTRQQEVQGALTVSATPGFAAHWLIPRLDRLHARHPEMDVRISAAAHLVDFTRDEVDIAVRFGQGTYEGLASERLLDEEIIPVCAPRLLEGRHPLRQPADLRHHQLLHLTMTPPHVMPAAVPDWGMWLRAAGVTEVPANRGTFFDSWPMLLLALYDGQGVALGRGSIMKDDLAAGRLVRLFEVAMPTAFSYWLVYPEGGLARAKVRAFRDWIVEESARS
jgi:LysR family transcriptional regulator, glycine cleavage system transcriptional activator